jgi:hypothetical protein
MSSPEAVPSLQQHQRTQSHVLAVAEVGDRLDDVRALAVPDITKKHVRIATLAAALSPVDVAYPSETALDGTPGLKYTRSLSRHGRSGGWRAKGHAPRRRAEARLYFDATLLTLPDDRVSCFRRFTLGWQGFRATANSRREMRAAGGEGPWWRSRFDLNPRSARGEG